jgi:uncharacterized protein YdaU (DUF1376 family)
MNYFQKHLGDIAKKTAHLTMLEYGAYNLILDAYYDREQGPTLVEATRWARARTDYEKAAVLAVLDEFFTLGDEGRYTQTRVEEEIAKASIQIEDAEGKRDNERERQRRHRERRKELFARLRDFDDVPPWDTKNEQLQERLNTHLSRVTNAVQTPDATATLYPIPNTHNPIEETTTCAAAPAAVVEVAPALPAEPAEPPAYTLPTNTGEEFPIVRQRVEEFVELYPGVDVMQELRKMRGWLISNPAKRKTKKGMMSFVNNWLSKQQNSAGSQMQGRRIGPASGRPSINNIGVAPGADDDIFNQMRTEL